MENGARTGVASAAQLKPLPQKGRTMSEHPIDHDLERRVRALELALSAAVPNQPPRRRSPIRRVLVVVASVISLAALPMMTVASDRFSDVSDAHPFHDEINELWGARITRGCATNPRRYCPDDAVSRGQMAGFLTRGLGRVAYDTGLSDHGGVLASVTIDAGGVPGGTGYVLINAKVTAATEIGELSEIPESCPCMIAVAVERSGIDPGDIGWRGNIFNLFGPEAPNGGDDRFIESVRATGSVTEVVAVPSGESTTFELLVQVTKTHQGPTVEVAGSMTALYVPFGEATP